MSSKLNIVSIIRNHLSTLRDARTDKTSAGDIASFYIFPLLLAIGLAILKVDYSKDVISAFVTIGALFAGLLLNLLFLVYDQRTKLQEKTKTVPDAVRTKVLEELYFNITYSTLLSLSFVVISVFQIIPIDVSVIKELPVKDLSCLKGIILDPLISFVGVHLVLTMVMILKRVARLFSAQ